MKRFMNKKVVAVVASTALSLGIAGAALAYYTANGSGSGSATASAEHDVTLTVTNVTLNGPGAAAVSVPYSFTNTLNNGDQTFGKVSISNITGYTASCPSSLADLAVATSANAIGHVADGAPYTASSLTEPTIAMTDLPTTDQSLCEGVVFTVTLTAAQGA